MVKTLDAPTQDYWKDFGYGKNKEKLKIGREVKGKVSGGGKVKTGRVTVTGGYIDFKITVGFRPKVIDVIAFWNGRTAWGKAEDGMQSCIFYNGSAFTNADTRLFRFDATNVGLLVSIDSDGFTVKSDPTCTLIYTCIG